MMTSHRIAPLALVSFLLVTPWFAAASPATLAPALISNFRIGPTQGDLWSEDSEISAQIDMDRGTIVLGVPEREQVLVMIQDSLGWNSQQLEVPVSDYLQSTSFGSAVAIDGDTLVVGAKLCDESSTNDAGAAFIYTRTNGIWSFSCQLPNDNPHPGGRFGTSVAITNDTVVIGTPYDDANSQWWAGTATVFQRHGNNWVATQQLEHDDPQSSDRFGEIVALSESGNTLIITSPSDDYDDYSNLGSVTVFEKNGTVYSRSGLLLAPDGELNSDFGASLQTDDRRIIIGDPGFGLLNHSAMGAAYVYEKSQSVWNQTQRLLPGNPASGMRYATRLALDGDFLLVSAPFDSSVGVHRSGSVYSYAVVGSTWSQVDWLWPPEPQDSAYFGLGLSLDGDTAMISASFMDTSRGQDSGAVFPALRSGLSWNLGQALPIAGVPQDGRFAASMAASGPWAIVGSPREVFDDENSQGAAHVWKEDDGWALVQRLVPSNPMDDERFGTSVSTDGDTMVVGAPEADHHGGDGAGAAYVFVQEGGLWAQHQILIPAVPERRSEFGAAVDVSGDTLIISATGMTQDGLNGAGAVYVFTRSGEWWIEDVTIRADHYSEYDRFGNSIALHQGEILVGTKRADVDGVVDAGAVYRFTRSGGSWVQSQKIISHDLDEDLLFGASLSVDGGILLVGAPGWDSPTLDDVGTVYSYDDSSGAFVYETSLISDQLVSNQAFGASVDYAHGVAFIGADHDQSDGIQYAGGGYAFHRIDGQWVLVWKAEPENPVRYDLFGASVAVSPTSLLLGSEGAAYQGISSSGAALVFVGPIIFGDSFESGNASAWSKVIR